MYDRTLDTPNVSFNIQRESNDGPVFVMIIADQIIATLRMNDPRDVSKLGWMLLDAASSNGEPYYVKDGE
jgi:hypothetical protein